MSAKQDAVYPRNAAALERQYNFGRSFAEVMGIAKGAQKTAETAQETATEAKKAYEGLDQEQIFKLLTNNGEVQGIFRGEDNQVYINANYITAGVIDAAVVTVVNLIAERLQSISGFSRLSVDSALLQFFFGEMETIKIRNASVTGGDDLTEGGAYPEIELIMRDQDLTPIAYGKMAANLLRLGGIQAEPVLNLRTTDNGRAYLGINGNTVGKWLSWKNNGDGTYTLIGKD